MSLIGASPALTDPSGDTPLLNAALWVQHLMLGTVATAIAVLAIAAVGAWALTGRVALRRAATVVLGCFVLFGAPVIAQAFFDLATANAEPGAAALPPPVVQTSPRRSPSQVPYDPYAGASVPIR